MIDPNKNEASDRLFQAIKEILTENDLDNLPLEIWVGDSKEVFQGVHRYLKRLHNLEINLPPVVIFPGHPLQVSKFADYIQMPTLLNCHRFYLKIVLKLGKKYHWLAKWFWKPLGKKWPIDRKYGYLVLSPNSSAGRKMNAKELSDDEAFEELKANWRPYWEQLYLEAGSGNFGYSIAERLDLVKRTKTFVNEKNAILCTGGGIRTKEQIGDLTRAGSDLVVVSTVLEQSYNSKELILQFLDAIRQNQL